MNDKAKGGFNCEDKAGARVFKTYDQADKMFCMTPPEYKSQMNACKDNN